MAYDRRTREIVNAQREEIERIKVGVGVLACVVALLCFAFLFTTVL
jgi:hypothetical protein